MNKKRLMKLVEFAEADKIPRERFGMGTFISYAPGTADGCTLKDCGTVGCVLGWATEVPAFKRLGLRFLHGDLVLGHDVGLGAARALFDLDFEQSGALFDSYLAETIRTPKQWAKHARKCIRQWEAQAKAA